MSANGDAPAQNDAESSEGFTAAFGDTDAPSDDDVFVECVVQLPEDADVRPKNDREFIS